MTLTEAKELAKNVKAGVPTSYVVAAQLLADFVLNLDEDSDLFGVTIDEE